MRYVNYGLVYEEPIYFEEMEAIQTSEEAEVTIYLEQPPEYARKLYEEKGQMYATEENIYLIYDDGLVLYIEKGIMAYIWNEQSDVTESKNIMFMMLFIIPTLIMMQRDYVILHGSALVKDGKAFIVSGVSGAGKSTTAMNLLKKEDISFLADDICAIRKEGDGFYVCPGPPIQKICVDAQKRNSQYEYYTVGTNDGKYYRKVLERYIKEPMPVDSMFVLFVSEESGVRIEELKGQQAFYALTHNMYRGEFINVMGVTPQKITRFIELANSMKIYALFREKIGNTEKLIISSIEENIVKK